jgi:hypothetical protein
MQRVLRSVFLVVLTTMAVAPTGRAQSSDARPTLSAKRLTDTVRLDGHLTESVWKRSNGSASFIQQDPVEGGPPSVSTRIWVAYDDEALYLAARLSYDDVSTITARKLRRDAGLGSDDRRRWRRDSPSGLSSA